MFGIVIPSSDALSEDERVRYRQVYCGVCHALKDRSGQMSRLSLSNDLTFLALVLSSLYEDDEVFDKAACALHPREGRPLARSACIDYAADMNVVMAYRKSLDDWADDASRAALLYAKALERCYRDIEARWPVQCRVVELGLERIARIERECPVGGEAFGGDEAARCFGAVLGELFAYREDRWAPLLREMGFWLGQFVYVMDAALDREHDERTGSYNPLLQTGLSVEELRSILSGFAAAAAAAFEKLPLVKDAHLMRSVLYSGIWATFNETYESAPPRDGAPAQQRGADVGGGGEARSRATRQKVDP